MIAQETTEQNASDTLGEILDAIASGHSMGLGAWAILNQVRRLIPPATMADVQREIANATPEQVERLANSVLGPTPGNDKKPTETTRSRHLLARAAVTSLPSHSTVDDPTRPA